QLFSILKGLYNLENPRLYGQKRYERHVKWVLLSYLIDEFNKVWSYVNIMDTKSQTFLCYTSS
ncbi:hypothetical protein FDC62_14215, partial [Clostridium botulinum]|nr:hypothetical protein [Clostridium botulinum]